MCTLGVAFLEGGSTPICEKAVLLHCCCCCCLPCGETPQPFRWRGRRQREPGFADRGPGPPPSLVALFSLADSHLLCCAGGEGWSLPHSGP